MDGTQVLTPGLGLQMPWVLKDQHLETAVSPRRLELYVEAERGSLYPCSEYDTHPDTEGHADQR